MIAVVREEEAGGHILTAQNANDLVDGKVMAIIDSGLKRSLKFVTKHISRIAKTQNRKGM